MWNEGFSGYSTVSGSGSVVPSVGVKIEKGGNESVAMSLAAIWKGATAVENLGIAPINTSTEPQPFMLADGQVNDSVEPQSQGKISAKRKAMDTERLTGKPLVDTYSKRSAGLLKKGEELAKRTGAYVVVFSARPESIGEGFHRLYISNDFKTADAELTERINHITGELNAIALELAHRAGHISRRKRSRTDATGETPRTTENTHPSDVPSTQPLRGDTAQNNAASGSPATTVTHNVHAPAVAGTPNQPTPWMSQNEIATVVHLLTTSRRSYSLDVLEQLVQSHTGVQAVYNGHAIPPLVRLLDNNNRHLVRRIVLILAKMTHHWGSCMSMLQGGVLPLFVRFLSQEMEEEVLTLLAHTLAQAISMCLPECKHYIRALSSRDDIQTLIHHLNLGRMEVRLATAEVIQGIASADVSGATRILGAADTGLSLCRLLLDCRNLSEEEKVASIILTSCQHVTPSSQTLEILETHILPRLIQLLEDDKLDIVIAACRILRHLYISGRFYEEHEEEVLLRLTRLLSHPDIHVFVEAAWTASTLTIYDESDPTLPKTFDSTVIRGLTRLLHHQDDQVVVKALRGLADVVDPQVLLDIVLEMASGGDIQQLICLLSSNNADIAAAALNLVNALARRGCSPGNLAISRILIRHGATAALVRNITSSNPLLDQTMDTLWRFPAFDISEAILVAGADKFLLHLLSSSDVKPLTIIRIFDSFWDDDFLPFKDVGIFQLLVPFAQRIMDMPDSFHKSMIWLLASFILTDESFCEEFRDARAEHLIVDYLAGITPQHDLYDRLTLCLESLRRNPESGTQSD